jgi:hypothetical protein
MGKKSQSADEGKNLLKIKGCGVPAHVSPTLRDPSAGSGQAVGRPRVQQHLKNMNDMEMLGLTSAKRLGEAVEAVFLAKATMLGFPVLKPWGDSRPYDFAVEGGRRLWRVQVKCATSHRGTRCSARAAGSGELYTLDDIDYLAAYVIRRDLWYVVPADAFVPRATVHFNYGPRSQGMFEIYREAWCLLTCSARARGKGDIPKRCRCEGMGVRCVVCPGRVMGG